MTFTIHEIFYTIQGEGANAGRPAVFVRFAGCNLWNGLERDRMSAICQFCDTEFRGGEKFQSVGPLVERIRGMWPDDSKPRFAVLTGGEPLLQVTPALLEALHWGGFEIAVETNGTIRPPRGINWLTVSPKAGALPVVTRADELKVVYPQEGLLDLDAIPIEATRRYVQPMDGPQLDENTQRAIDFCMSHPQWRLSLQTHKFVGLP